jgi:hypothetical protein
LGGVSALRAAIPRELAPSLSLGWMAVIPGLIALEKTLPWRRLATYGTSLLLFGLAGGLLAGAVA